MQDATGDTADCSIGRIVSVTGSKAIVLLDDNRSKTGEQHRPEMGTLLGIDTSKTIALGLVSALSVPVPAQKEGEPEVWIAELGLVGEIHKDERGGHGRFNRGVSSYPALGDRVRLASKEELLKAFSSVGEHSVRVGVLRQDATIPAMVKTDDLLGKHFAILGTTGTGKSCTTALILRSILEKNPNAHIVLLDPHNEYSTSFGERAEVVTTQDLHLPYWLLTFEELVEVLIGAPEERKQEIEILQELVPLCKGKYGISKREQERGLKRASIYAGRYTVDTPVPYRMSDLTSALDDKMGMLENKKDLSPYRALKTRIDTISQDQRYSFMFGGFTVYDQMTEVLGRIFRVPVKDKPITILELTGLPTEIVNVVVSVLCRMTFDFALWGDGHVPVTLVCEEAHRYVPVKAGTGFEPAKRAIAKIAKEGRKYGASLCIVTQRPAEIDPTILSQCNTVFALRMSNDRDQEIVRAAVADTGSGLLEFLPSLGQREAIAFGDGVSLPVRIRFDELPKNALPRSSTAKFSEKWQSSMGDETFLNTVVERWRASGNPHAAATEESLDGEPHVPSDDLIRGHAAAVNHISQTMGVAASQSRLAPVSAPAGAAQSQARFAAVPAATQRTQPAATPLAPVHRPQLNLQPPATPAQSSGSSIRRTLGENAPPSPVRKSGGLSGLLRRREE
jgi:hypothetical protein